MKNKQFRQTNMLMLSYYFPPMSDVGGLRAYSFARYLPEHNFKITIITGKTNENLNQSLLEKLPQECKVVTIKNWFAGPFNCSWSAIFKAYQISLQESFDLIFATGPPWATLKAGFVLSKLTGLPLVSDFRDPWNYGKLWGLKKRRFVSNKFETLSENAIANHSTRIIYTVSGAAQMHRHLTQNSKEKTIIIPNGYDEMGVEPIRLKSKEKCIFAHIGSLHPEVRPLTIVLDALAIACRNPSFAREVHFQQIGPIYDELLSQIEQRNLTEQIIFTSTVPLTLAQQFMRGSDVLVLFNPLVKKMDQFQPCKIFEYLAAQKPILGIIPENSPSRELIKKTGNSCVCTNQEPQLIAKAFIDMWNMWRENKLTKHNLDITIYSRRNQAKELSKHLKKIVLKTN